MCVTIHKLMSEDTIIKKLPVTFRLYERKGPKTERLVNTIRNMAASLNVTDSVKLIAIKPDPGDDGRVIILYTITFDPKDPAKAERTMKFNKSVFENLFGNYPSYVDPVNPLTEGSDESSSYN